MNPAIEGAATVAHDYFAALRRYMNDRGLDYTRHLWFDGFAEYPIERDGHPVFAGFKPPHDGFWLAVTLDGKPFATYAAMPMDLVSNLTEHFEVDGLYRGQDRWEIVDPEARAFCDTITGTVMFGGGIVVDKPQRGTNKSRLMMTLLPLLGRIIGRDLYHADHFIYLQPAGRSFSARTDRQHVWPGAVRWTRNGEELGPPRVLGYASWAHVEESIDQFLASSPT